MPEYTKTSANALLEDVVKGVTSRISDSLIEPCKSCLLANTSKDAPAKRWRFEIVSVRNNAKKRGIYIFGQKVVQLLLTIKHSQPVCAVNNPDKSISLFKVIPPIRPKGTLTTNIP